MLTMKVLLTLFHFISSQTPKTVLKAPLPVVTPSAANEEENEVDYNEDEDEEEDEGEWLIV